MIRVLHELAYLDGGGVARLLYEYYVHMDRARIRFDFLILDDRGEGILEEPLRRLGCGIFRIPSLRKDPAGHLRGMKEIISEGGYDTVHSHIADRSAIILSIAKKCGVRNRFAHSHLAYDDCSLVKRAVNFLFLRRAKSVATQLFACGTDAGIYMWGKKAVLDGKVRIMRNAVDTARFRFNGRIRTEIRRELGLEGCHAAVIVGRLEHQKNHAFLLEAFAELTKRDEAAMLAVIGNGSLEGILKEKAAKLQIADRVLFLGVRTDVDRLLHGMDVFVLPSFYEGLPVVLVEAQANGLPCLVSDAVTKEMAVTDLVSFLPCGRDPGLWAEEMSRAFGDCNGEGSFVKAPSQAFYAEPSSEKDAFANTFSVSASAEESLTSFSAEKPFRLSRSEYADEVGRGGYDIAAEAVKMQSYYEKICRKKKEKGGKKAP